MKRILITGAGSYVGTAVENYLLSSPEEFSVDVLDMTNPSWQSASFAPYDVVFHVAGIVHSDSGKVTPEREAEYFAVNTDLTVSVAKKAKSEGVSQFIFMSSILVYGSNSPVGRPHVICADTKPYPENCYGRSKLEAEKGISELADGSFAVAIVRAPMIYGKGSRGNYPTLSKMARKLPLFPNVRNQRSMLYIENLCGFIRVLIEDRADGIFFPQNLEYVCTADMVRSIGEVHGKRIRLVRGFGWLLRIMGRFMPIVNKAFGNLVYDKSMSEYPRPWHLVDFRESIERTEK